MNLKDLRELGSPFCIYHNIGSLDGGSVELVHSRSSGRLITGISGGQKHLESDRIIICHIAYDYAAANGNGFDLVAREYSSSPGGGTDRLIVESRASTGSLSVRNNIDCIIPLDGGTASPSLTNPADLFLTTTATGPTTGTVIIVGVTSASNEFVLANSYYGSPFNASP